MQLKSSQKVFCSFLVHTDVEACVPSAKILCEVMAHTPRRG